MFSAGGVGLGVRVQGLGLKVSGVEVHPPVFDARWVEEDCCPPGYPRPGVPCGLQNIWGSGDSAFRVRVKGSSCLGFGVRGVELRGKRTAVPLLGYAHCVQSF